MIDDFFTDDAIRELIEAGWTHVNSTTWKSPQGELFRGPAGAYYAMIELKRMRYPEDFFNLKEESKK